MDNSTSIVLQFIKYCQIPVTDAIIRKGLEEHPDFPSLLSISDILKEHGVINGAYQVRLDDLKDIPVPFIAHVAVETGKFIIVTGINEKSVFLINDQHEEREVDIDNFKDVFNGNILMIENYQGAGDPEYVVTKRREVLAFLRIPFVLVGFCIILLSVLFLFTPYLEDFNWQIGALTLFKITGVVVSVLLLVQSIDANNPAIKKICSWKNSNCNAILSSKAAKVLGDELSWSEVGYLYFTGSLFLLLFNSGSVALIQLLAILNVLSLPYTVYSIYYQARIARQWCLLCCTTQALLWLEFIPLGSYFLQPFIFPDRNEWIKTIIAFLSPALFWVFIKPFLLKAQQIQPLRKKLNKIKYDESLFRKILTGQPEYALPADGDLLVLGHENADRVITLVTNTFCGACSKAHQTLNGWLEKGDVFKLQIVFAPHEQNDQVAAHILALKSNDKGLASKALHHWYQQDHKDFSSWSAQYPVSNQNGTAGKLKNQIEWCSIINLEHTPTVLINGYKLPMLYQLEDIRFFI